MSSYTWFRRSDRSVVDLHDTLFGVEADPEQAWALLSEETETMRIGTLEVETLGHPARLLYVVLHAAQHESHRFEQPLKDLERALRHAEEQPGRRRPTSRAACGPCPRSRPGFACSRTGHAWPTAWTCRTSAR